MPKASILMTQISLCIYAVLLWPSLFLDILQQYSKILQTDNKGPDETVQKSRVSCTFDAYIISILPNYRTCSYKRTVKLFRSPQITASVIFVYFFIKTYVVGTHSNCIDLSMQFK